MATHPRTGSSLIQATRRGFAALSLAACGAAAACGTSASTFANVPPGTGTLASKSPSGTRSFQVRDVLVFRNVFGTQISTEDLYITLTDATNACGLFEREQDLAGASSLQLYVTKQDGTYPPIPAGTYGYSTLTDDGPPILFAITRQTLDGTCQPISPEHGEQGSITLTRIDEQGAAGTFDVFVGGEELTGTFDGSYCPRPSSFATRTCVSASPAQ